MTKHTLDYYVSCRSSRPAYPILQELQDKFGSHFEKLSRDDLHRLLAICVCWPHGKISISSSGGESEAYGEAAGLLKKLYWIDKSYPLGFIPFLYEAMRGRK